MAISLANARRPPLHVMLFCMAFMLILVSFNLFSNKVGSFTSMSSSKSYNNSFALPDHISPDDPVRACFVVLVRNSELNGLLSSMRQLEDTFNRKFNYPYVFLNDDEFSPEFKDLTSAATSAKVEYGKVDAQMWGYPSFINQTLAAETRTQMAATGLPYGGSESYRHMCRFQSGFFFRHPLLDQYDYYWRVEPDVDFTCQIDYDVFKYMRNNGKKYGFTIAFREFMGTVPTLWDTIRNFKKDHPEVADKLPAKGDSLIDFVTDDNGQTYNGCHFWTNFEIASLDLWRSNDYLKFFGYLDRSGGFFYERWGDAPVHSIAAALMLRKEEFHFFNDIGYRHTAYQHCPVEPEHRSRCACNPDENFDYEPNLSCYSKYVSAF